MPLQSSSHVLICSVNPSLETADQRRIRMAKELINKAKASQQEGNIEEDDFFITSGVHRDDDDPVNKIL